MSDWNAGVDKRFEPQDDERQILIDKVADLQAEVDQLRRYCKEWVCENCETCFPDAPQPGFLCVICPKCKGPAMPYPLWEVRKMMGQRDRFEDSARTLAFALQGLYDDQVDYLKINNLGGMDNHWMRAARIALADYSQSAKEPK